MRNSEALDINIHKENTLIMSNPNESLLLKYLTPLNGRDNSPKGTAISNRKKKGIASISRLYPVNFAITATIIITIQNAIERFKIFRFLFLVD